MKGKDLIELAYEILQRLGEADPKKLLTSKGKKQKKNRDIAIYLMTGIGTYTNKEIGKIFGVGYTAITEARKPI